jgi:hypothetical protein
MKCKLILLALLVTGCSTVVPVKEVFPELPEVLAVPCKSLVLLEGDATLSKLMDTVAQNYTIYHECSAQLGSLLEWYTEQKKIFNKIAD